MQVYPNRTAGTLGASGSDLQSLPKFNLSSYELWPDRRKPEVGRVIKVLDVKRRYRTLIGPGYAPKKRYHSKHAVCKLTAAQYIVGD